MVYKTCIWGRSFAVAVWQFMITLKLLPTYSSAIQGDLVIGWYEFTGSFLSHTDMDLPIRPRLHRSTYARHTDPINNNLKSEHFDSKQKHFDWYYNI